MRYSSGFKLLAVLGLGLATACGTSDVVTTGGLTHARLSLANGAAPALSGVAASIVADMDGGQGHITLSMVDSLIVHVSAVDVLPDSLLLRCFPARGDSAHGFHPMDPDSDGHPGEPERPADCRGRHGDGPLGPGTGGGMGGGRFGFPPIHPDSLRPDSGWGRRADQWFSLSVVGDGKLDLVHLPTDSASALVLASGDLPAGDYGAARLILTDATIYFDTAITVATEDSTSFTFKADTGYTVLFPRMESKFGFVTNAGFTIPSGGGNVSLIFDTDQTVRGAVVTDSGQVRIVPLCRPRHPND